jgi:hypothetical protein
MLLLDGNDAAIMLVAKSSLRDLGSEFLEVLQAAIAVMCGVSEPGWISEDVILRNVAALHDKLGKNGLLRTPAVSLVESMTRLQWVNKSETRSAPRELLIALVNNITCMKVRSDGGVLLVDWESSLEPGFEENVRLLYQTTHDGRNETSLPCH